MFAIISLPGGGDTEAPDWPVAVVDVVVVFGEKRVGDDLVELGVGVARASELFTGLLALPFMIETAVFCDMVGVGGVISAKSSLKESVLRRGTASLLSTLRPSTTCDWLLWFDNTF